MSKYMRQTIPPHEGALFPLQLNYSLKKARRGRTARAARAPHDARTPLSSPAAQAVILCPWRRVTKSGHEARFLLVTPDRVAKPFQPIAAVGGVFDDGVRLHEVRIDGADEARTVRGEALELLRRIEAVERVPVLEVELHHGVNGQVEADAERGGRGRHGARQV